MNKVNILFKIHLEQKNPNKQALVSIVRSTAKVTLKIDNSTNKLNLAKNTIQDPPEQLQKGLLINYLNN